MNDANINQLKFAEAKHRAGQGRASPLTCAAGNGASANYGVLPSFNALI